MTRQAYDLVAAGFGPGASGPLMLTAELPAGGGGDPQRALTLLRERVAAQPRGAVRGARRSSTAPATPPSSW